MPTSLGRAHEGELDRDQGGLTEQEGLAMDADMMRMLEAKGTGGAFLFIWEDEWFKRTWNTFEHQDPERRQLWHDPLTNEQWFGLVATDPDPVVDAAAELIPESGAFEYVYVWADASWVHLEVTLRDGIPGQLGIEADVVPAAKGPDYRIAVDTEERSARVDVRRELDPIRLDTVADPYRPGAAKPWHLYSLLTNRAYTVEGVDYPAEYFDVGLLTEGIWDPSSDDYDSTSTWQVDEERRTIRMRIPWSMLGLADPSARTALGTGNPAKMVSIDGIGLTFDVGGEQAELDFTWPEWNHTTYQQRQKAGIEVVEDAFRDLAP